MKQQFICKICSSTFRGRSDSKNLFCSRSCSRENIDFINRLRAELFHNLDVELYKINLKKCKHCSDTLQYDKRMNKFCSISCSTQYSNKIRYDNGFKMANYTKEKLALLNRKKALIRYNNSPKVCKMCNKLMPYEKRHRTTCSHFCLKQSNVFSGRTGGLRSAQVRPKRSKNEIAMHDLCEKYFNMVTSNDPIFGGWDADILIHDYKIAILWNGDWHYQEMNCYNHSLKQVQNRDCHKSKLIKEAGWVEYIIKDTTKEPTKPIDAFYDLLLFLQLY